LPGLRPVLQAGRADDKRFFDLPSFVLDRLETAGVERREWVGRDTRTEPEWFFSNRRAFLPGRATTAACCRRSAWKPEGKRDRNRTTDAGDSSR
jgi:copper oxidase (laccase) domain-containing protein